MKFISLVVTRVHKILGTPPISVRRISKSIVIAWILVHIFLIKGTRFRYYILESRISDKAGDLNARRILH
jgi:hypothetical protein